LGGFCWVWARYGYGGGGGGGRFSHSPIEKKNRMYHVDGPLKGHPGVVPCCLSGRFIRRGNCVLQGVHSVGCQYGGEGSHRQQVSVSVHRPPDAEEKKPKIQKPMKKEVGVPPKKPRKKRGGVSFSPVIRYHHRRRKGRDREGRRGKRQHVGPPAGRMFCLYLSGKHRTGGE